MTEMDKEILIKLLPEDKEAVDEFVDKEFGVFNKIRAYIVSHDNVARKRQIAELVRIFGVNCFISLTSGINAKICFVNEDELGAVIAAL